MDRANEPRALATGPGAGGRAEAGGGNCGGHGGPAGRGDGTFHEPWAAGRGAGGMACITPAGRGDGTSEVPAAWCLGFFADRVACIMSPSRNTLLIESVEHIIAPSPPTWRPTSPCCFLKGAMSPHEITSGSRLVPAFFNYSMVRSAACVRDH